MKNGLIQTHVTKTKNNNKKAENKINKQTNKTHTHTKKKNNNKEEEKECWWSNQDYIKRKVTAEFVIIIPTIQT